MNNYVGLFDLCLNGSTLTCIKNSLQVEQEAKHRGNTGMNVVVQVKHQKKCAAEEMCENKTFAMKGH